MKKRKKQNECWDCGFKMKAKDGILLLCINPDRNMTGNIMGIRQGQFNYPYKFDPVWKNKLCSNWKKKREVFNG